MHVLIVDDQVIAENLYDFRETCGPRCDFAPSLAAADVLVGRHQFDAMVLDRSLPDGYLAKPFALKEVEARLPAIKARSAPVPPR